MSSLYVVSNEPYSGKSSVCLGLAKLCVEIGKRVGYFKPVGTLPTKIGELLTDEDAYFAHKLLRLTDPLELISPVLLTPLSYKEGLMDSPEGAMARIIDAYNQIKQDKDFVLIEGSKSFFDGMAFNLSVLDLYDDLGASLLMIASYSTDLIDVVIAMKRLVGKQMIGVIINKVPRSQYEWVQSIVTEKLLAHEVKVYGIIIRDPSLSSVSIEALAEHLGGQILCAEDKKTELVESFMIGAMGQEQALRFFRRKANKAVITGGDRPDIQLAALETPTKCLILTGNLRPSSIVLARAEELGVPMILVEMDTLSAVQKAEELIGKVRVQEVEKINKLVDILKNYVDSSSIFKDAGLPLR